MRPLFRFARQAALTMISMASCLVSTVAPAQETAAQAPVRSFVAAPVANINITPRRVVFDGTKRTEAVYVFNQGTAPVTVDVGLVDNVMLRNGEIVPPEKLAKRDAADQAAGAAARHSMLLLTWATILRATALRGGQRGASHSTC